jgi:hypothetical protein
MPADLFEDHRLIVATAEAFLATVRRTPRAGMDEVSMMRAKLGSLTMAHLRAEDETIIAPLQASGHLASIAGAADVITTIRQSRSTYSDHIRKWTPQAIAQDWEGYGNAVEHIVTQLRLLVALEEEQLYWPALRLIIPEERADTGS